MKTILLLFVVTSVFSVASCLQDQGDNGSDLSQLRSKLRICRINLNESEEDRDLCIEEKSKASAALRECETRCSETDSSQRTLQVNTLTA